MSDDGPQILIVDDKPAKILALRAVLDELASVVSASSGRDALRCVLNNDFAVVLLDINMPDMDGFETAQLIRQRKASRHTPIIFLTAEPDAPYMARSYALGAADYILAPFVPEVLRTKVSVLVDLHRKTALVKTQATAIERRMNQLQKLTRASISIHSAQSVDAVLEAMTDAARDVLDAEHAVAVLDVGSVRRRVASGNPIDETSQGELPSLATPLTESGGQVIGTLRAWRGADDVFPEEERAMLVLTQLGQFGSIAVQNCLLAGEREANRLKDEFLATLSHELRTPLTAIVAWTELLKTARDPERIAHGIDVIERNAQAQVKLVEELLDASQIVSGKLRVTRSAVSIQDVMARAVDSLRRAAEAKGVNVALTPSADPCIVYGDPGRLGQVATNLLTNAIKFTPRGGHVVVELHERGDEIALSIRDDGEGIAADFLPHMFERFRQADSTATRAHSGLGIGLALVREIVELHGGTVHAASAGKGRGATLTVTLPRAERRSEPRAAPASAHPSEDAQLLGTRILLVDDDDDTRDLLKIVLETVSAEVFEVSSAKAALAALEARPPLAPDVLVTDISMPEMDGFELIRRVRASASADIRDLPAVALTAHAGIEVEKRVLDAGFQLHVTKPFDAAALVRAVATARQSRLG